MMAIDIHRCTCSTINFDVHVERGGCFLEGADDTPYYRFKVLKLPDISLDEYSATVD